MDPRTLRTLVVIVVMLLLALTAFTFLLRRYQNELKTRSNSDARTRVVRPHGAPATPVPPKGGMAPDAVVTASPPAVTSAAVEGVGQVDAAGAGAR